MRALHRLKAKANGGTAREDYNLQTQRTNKNTISELVSDELR